MGNVVRYFKRQASPFTCCVVVLILGAVCITASGVQIKENKGFDHWIEFGSQTGAYYRIFTSPSLTDAWSVVAIEPSGAGIIAWTNDAIRSNPPRTLFYKVGAVPIDQPFDTDGDGMHDVYEMEFPFLNPLDHLDESEDFDGDGVVKLRRVRTRPTTPPSQPRYPVPSRTRALRGVYIECWSAHPLSTFRPSIQRISFVRAPISSPAFPRSRITLFGPTATPRPMGCGTRGSPKAGIPRHSLH